MPSEGVMEKYQDRLNTLYQINAALKDEDLSFSQRKSLEEKLRSVRRELAWALTIEQGMTQMSIAEVLKCSQPTVSRDLNTVTTDVLQRLEDMVEQEKLTQIERLRVMIEQLWDAWEASKDIERIVTQGQSGGKGEGGGGPDYVKTRVKGREGSRGYLRDIRQCMADIRKILGADAPLKVAHTTPDGKEEARGVVIFLPENNRKAQDGYESE